MAQWFTDFSEYATAGDAIEYESWSPFTTRTLVLSTPSWASSPAVGFGSGLNRLHFARLKDAITSSNIEVYGRVSPGISSAEADIYVAGASGFSAYVFAIRRSAGEVRLNRWLSGNQGLIGVQSKTIPSVAKVRCFWNAATDELKLKVWDENDTEPAGWDLERTDLNLTASGTVGFFTFGSEFQYSEIGIGTNGDPAPTSPISSAVPTLSTPTATATTANSISFSIPVSY